MRPAASEPERLVRCFVYGAPTGVRVPNGGIPHSPAMALAALARPLRPSRLIPLPLSTSLILRTEHQAHRPRPKHPPAHPPKFSTTHSPPISSQFTFLAGSKLSPQHTTEARWVSSWSMMCPTPTRSRYRRLHVFASVGCMCHCQQHHCVWWCIVQLAFSWGEAGPRAGERAANCPTARQPDSLTAQQPNSPTAQQPNAPQLPQPYAHRM